LISDCIDSETNSNIKVEAGCEQNHGFIFNEGLARIVISESNDNNIKINKSFSTNEIQKEILSKALDNIEDVTKVYEKARYSNQEVTKDDVEILKHKAQWKK